MRSLNQNFLQLCAIAHHSSRSVKEVALNFILWLWMHDLSFQLTNMKHTLIFMNSRSSSWKIISFCGYL
jgi:hypothetical protein